LRSIVLVTIDGWGTNLLGCYGNSLCETPALDSFAAQGLVFDRCWTSSCQLESILKSIVDGLHPVTSQTCLRQAEAHEKLQIVETETAIENPVWLPKYLRAAGYTSHLLTDEPRIAESPWIEDFDDFSFLDPIDIAELVSEEQGDTDSENEWLNTRLARALELAWATLKKSPSSQDFLPSWTWLHFSGLARTWDAPYEYRLRLCDPEEDPEPTRQRTPVNQKLTETTDPDVVFDATCGASGQGLLIDQLMAGLEVMLKDFPESDERMFIVMGTRGYPLGEHARIGMESAQPYAELIHVPLLVRIGEGVLGLRSSTAIQPMALNVLMRRWLDGTLSSDLGELDDWMSSQTSQPVNFVADGECRAALVGRWSVVTSQASSSAAADDDPIPAIGVYLSPEDRWQQNNVQSRIGEVSKTLEHLVEELDLWLKNGGKIDEKPSPDISLFRPVD
jgi:hypothetical protein